MEEKSSQPSKFVELVLGSISSIPFSYDTSTASVWLVDNEENRKFFENSEGDFNLILVKPNDDVINLLLRGLYSIIDHHSSNLSDRPIQVRVSGLKFDETVRTLVEESGFVLVDPTPAGFILTAQVSTL